MLHLLALGLIVLASESFTASQMVGLFLLGIVVCGLMGLVIGYLALRTSGIYFIMITLAFAQMLFLFVSLEQFGGDDGMSIDRAEFGFIDLYNPLRLYFLIWVTLALSVWV